MFLSLIPFLTDIHTLIGIWSVSVVTLIVSSALFPLLKFRLRQAGGTVNPAFAWWLGYSLPVLIGQAAVFMTLSAIIFIPTPDIIRPQLPMFEPLLVTPEHPLILEFDRPLSSQTVVTLQPVIVGEWRRSSQKYFPLVADTLSFHPTQSLLPDTEYTVEINRILPLTWINLGTADGALFVFKTTPGPLIERTSPADSQSAFKTSEPVRIYLDRASSAAIDWSYSFSPELKASLEVSDDLRQLVITPEHPLNHQTTYTFSLVRTSRIYDYQLQQTVKTLETDQILQTTFTTVTAAALEQITPQGGGVLPKEPIKLRFSQPMNQAATQQAISFEPFLDIQFTWTSSKDLEILPVSGWRPGTSYTLTINPEAQTLNGGRLTQALTHTISVIDAVEVSGTIPSNNYQNQPVTDSIGFTFDQPVDQASAEDKFSINPQVNGAFSWNQNSLTFTPSTQFQKQTQYTATLATGIKSIEGRDSKESFTLTFNTISEKFVLDVPWEKQDDSFTCYAAAAQMVLKFRGIPGISENQILDYIGFDTTARNFATNTWGNPNAAIVGTINGSGSGGYGVHWEPIAGFLNQYREVEVKRGWNLTGLLNEVTQGNPVMVWWVNGVWPAKNVSWNTPDAGKVYTVNGMHVEVVKGYVGSLDQPKSIITNDPWRGERYYTPETFLSLWKWFNHTGIIIR